MLQKPRGGAMLCCCTQLYLSHCLFFSSRRRHTRLQGDWSSDVCSSDLYGTSAGALLCLEFKTGTVKWDDRSIAPAALCYADGRLYLHGENGEVALVEATPEAYREKGRFKPSDAPDRGASKSWAYPVIANGRLYIRDLGTLWCYDVKVGK